MLHYVSEHRQLFNPGDLMMDLEQVNKWRDLASKIGAAFCVIALLALVDGLLVHFREPANLVKVLPGLSIEINGELTDEAHQVEDLTFTSNSDQFKVIFEAIHKGYFLGGDMWRGQLLVGKHLAPGEYSLSVIPKRTVSLRKAPAFRIIVYPDAQSLQKSSASLIRRWFGISAFIVAAGCLPGILLGFGAVYLLSGKREALLVASGRAEIYRVLRKDGAFEIYFGMGTEQGVQPGLHVQVYNEDGQLMALARVEAATAAKAVAIITVDREIRTGFMVLKNRS
jgi:hypothetical protein